MRWLAIGLFLFVSAIIGNAQALDRADSELKIGLDLLYKRQGILQPKMGYRYLEKAALKGDPRAVFNMGICLEQGLGTQKNCRLAAECFRRAGEKGIIQAQFNWALVIRDGIDADKSLFLDPIVADSLYASELLLKLSNRQFVPAMREYGLLNSQTKLGQTMLENAAQKGDEHAMMWIADFLMIQRQSMDRAYSYYSTLATLDKNPNAWSKKGWCLDYGVGVTADSVQARYCYEKGAQGKDLMGMTHFARMLLEGTGGEKDIDVALSILYICSREYQDPYAIFLLGLCSLNGIGQHQDLDAAERFFTLADDMGYTPATTQLAHLKWTQAKTPSARKQALKHYEKAVKKNDIEALESLANIYERGMGVVSDPEYAQMLRLRAKRLRK